MTVGFGYGLEGGTKLDQVDVRGKTYYNHYFSQKKPDMHIHQANHINKARNDFNLSNKFEYGQDI